MQIGINKFVIMGNTGMDVKSKTLPNGDLLANVSIATTTKWKDKDTGEDREDTQWHYVTAYKKVAEIIRDYVKKGQKIHVEGHMKYRKYQDNDGKDVYVTDFIVDDVQFC